MLNPLSIKRVLYILLSGLISFQATSQENGILNTLESLIEIQKNELQSRPASAADATFSTKIENIKNIYLTPSFMRSVLFSSEHRYLQFIKDNECHFYAFLQNDLLKSYDNSNIVEAKVHYNDNQEETIRISKDLFLQAVYKKKCFTNNELGTLFNDENFKKTFSSIALVSPKNTTECQQVYNNWIASPYIPYLCKIPDTITRGRQARVVLQNLSDDTIAMRASLNDRIRRLNFYEENLDYYQTSYIQNLCETIENQELFCKQYSTLDAWAKMFTGELNKSALEYRCRILSGKNEPLKVDELRACAEKLKKTPELCTGRAYEGYPARFPSTDCNDTSIALSRSRLNANYQDCPGMIDNEGITNLHRIINHFEKRDVITSTTTCANEANYTFAKLNIDFNNPEGWPLRICYKDRIENEEICLPFVPGENPNTELAENQVVTNIVKRIMSVPNETFCRLVDNKTFNPVLLSYKSGCFIVYDQNRCTTLECPKKIFVELKEITELRYQGFPTFDYFPTSFTNEKFSISNILQESLKITERPIRNLTELTTYLDSFKDGLIHGIGCLEDLRPQLKQRYNFNECTPLPFIIDGYNKINDETFVAFRSSTDEVHAPKLVPWSFIFTAISSYRELHPRSLWTLYGIKK